MALEKTYNASKMANILGYATDEEKDEQKWFLISDLWFFVDFWSANVPSEWIEWPRKKINQ